METVAYHVETDAEWLAANCAPSLRKAARRERKHQLRSIPEREWEAARHEDHDALGQRVSHWLQQPAGAVDLINLSERLDKYLGHPSTPLIDVCRLGEDGAALCDKLHTWLSPEETAAMIAPRFDVRLPQAGRQGVTVEGIGKRLEDGRVWKRNLVRRHLQALEQGRISAGQVRRGADTYVSQQTLSLLQTKWKDQNEALRHALATSNEGDEVSLFELQQSSVANPRVRFAELITRVKGFELVAEELGHTAVFVTVTAPSAYHPSKTVSSKRKRGERAFKQIINPAWVAAGKPTPKQANDYLCQTWGKVRAAADRRGLRVYGLRTTEPHADACPHWHMMLFGEPEALTRFVALFQDYACQAYPDELTGKVWSKEGGKWHKMPATNVRFNCQVMNPAQVLPDGRRVGGAVAYLTKYLTKNLDGKSEQRREDGEHLAMGDDYEADTDSITGAQKVRAWASLWHVRQFQFYGGPPVALWRELRKLRGAKQDDTVIDQAAAAADTGDWGLFCQLLGGPLARRKDLPLSLAKEDRPEQLNRYGEAACAVVKGIEAGAAKVVTRTKTWAIDWRKKQVMVQGAAEGLAARTGEARPSRTCANNCTQLLADTLNDSLPPAATPQNDDDYPDDGPPLWWNPEEDPGLDEPPPFDAGYFDHCAESGPPDWWTDRDECGHLGGDADWVRCDDDFEL